MANIFDQLRKYYEGLQPGQQRILVAAVVLALVSLVAVGWWSANDGYRPLFSTGDPSEVRMVAAALDEQSIPYQVSPDGSTLLVRPEDEGRARVASASAGKVLGYELLDSIELGTSPYREQKTYQRSLEGELSRTVSSLEKVAAARVHIVLPERSAFLRDDRPPSASVQLRLRPGAVLTPLEVRGITALVSGAVEGLRSADVVLVDQDGALLSGGAQEDAALAGVPSLVALKRQEELRTSNAIAEALERVLGTPQAISIGVTVELETTARDTTRRTVDPEGSALISESIRDEASESVRPGGVPGTEANLPEAGGEPTNATQNTQISEIRNNYEPSRVEAREVTAPGTVKRVSAGVVVDSAAVRKLAVAMLAAAAGDGAEGAPTTEAVDTKVKELEKQIEQTARTAMGFDDERGDGLSVTFLPFSATDSDLLEADTSGPFLTETTQSLLLLALAVLLFFFLVIRPLVAAVARAAQPPLPPALEAGADAALTSSLTDGRAGSDGRPLLGAAEGDDAAKREVSRNLTERLRNMVDNFENVDAADLNRLVDLEREGTAQVLHRWIREG